MHFVNQIIIQFAKKNALFSLNCVRPQIGINEDVVEDVVRNFKDATGAERNVTLIFDEMIIQEGLVSFILYLPFFI